MLHNRNPLAPRSTAVLVALALLVSACGGGGAAAVALLAGVGSGGTGIGVVTGFGSLIVDGVRYDDTTASYRSEENQGAPTAIAPTAATIGQTVDFAYDASGAVTSVLVSPELVGSVTAVGQNSITVLGTTIAINSSVAAGPLTGLVGYASPTAIQVGDRIAAYGLPKTDAQGAYSLQATLIVKKPAGTGVRISGYVSQYSAAAASFVLGKTTVTVGAASISPTGTALANGQLVTVWSNAAPAANTLAASAIRIKSAATASGKLTVSGPVSAYSGAASFKVRDVRIDASSAAIAPAGTSLTEGKYVVAAGNFDAGSNKLVATSLTVYAPTPAEAVELHGTVLNFVSASSFTVRGVVVDASTANFSGGTAGDLANGAFVEIKGALANNVVLATRVSIEAATPAQAPAGATLDVEGKIAAYDAKSGAYTITLSSGSSMSGNLSASTFYKDGTAADFASGKSVTLRGSYNGSTLSISSVSFPPAGSTVKLGEPSKPGITHMEGIVSNVTATTFMLNGLTIQINGVPLPGGGLGSTAFTSGTRVEVEVQVSGGQYLATSLDIESD